MRITLTVNGDRHRLDVEPRRTLADALREDLGLTGTHLGCEHGVCGACTVLLDDEPVRACLLFAVQAEGCAVATVEGLAAPDGTLHPLQEAFSTCHGLQCGACTPGMLMTAAHLLAVEPAPDRERIRAEMAGNLCRCTGYVGIVDAIEDAARAVRRVARESGDVRAAGASPDHEDEAAPDAPGLTRAVSVGDGGQRELGQDPAARHVDSGVDT